MARLIMALSCACCGFPVNFYPMRAASLILLRKVFPKWGAEHEVFSHYLLTVVFFLMALGLALNVHEIGQMFSAVGGTAGACIVFIFPAVVWFCHRRKLQAAAPAPAGPLLRARLAESSASLRSAGPSDGSLASSMDGACTEAEAPSALSKAVAGSRAGASLVLAVLMLVIGVTLLGQTLLKEFAPELLAMVFPQEGATLMGYACTVRWGC
uniref:Amino acid transporter transmembrane domain-containing protein n=1 Tax=Pyramimonas obovata TaxID=1411642 RepID=A0A7S0MVL2_9CHLO|mmetsp:Transcript_13598/g.28976  ORF Transcript_13598/g.28976 Transcript_13598/m.28976 type:complete len:211 (+) Transcript_13598:2-634(+)